MKLLIAGDSLAADYPASSYPMMGWGQALRYFIKEEIELKNFARPGRSTKRFNREGHWDNLLKETAPGDQVLISFGHNDQKPGGTAPAQFRENLRQYCRSVREKGAAPCLITAIIRIREWDNGSNFWSDTQREYPQLLRETAAEEKVPLLDLQQYSVKLARQLGRQETERLYAFPSPRGNWVPEGALDTTHSGIAGAHVWARFLVQEAFDRDLPLKACFQELQDVSGDADCADRR